MSPRVRLGFVGAGQWARSAHLPSLRGCEEAELVAVASRSRASAASLAEVFGFRAVEPDVAALLARDDLDALVVTAPVSEHHAIVRAALEHDLHVLCEAALTLRAVQARELVGLARARVRIGATTLPRPFLHGGERVRELLAEEALGPLESAAFSFRGNPWLFDDPERSWRVRDDLVPPVLLGVTAAVLLELLGPVERVQCRLARRRGPVRPNLCPDYAAGLLGFSSGLELSFHAGASAAPLPASGLQVFGARGTLVWDWSRPGSVLLGRSGARTLEEVGAPPEPDLGRAWPYTRRFVHAVLGGEPARPDFARGLAELELIEACQRSSASGSWQRPDPGWSGAGEA